MSEKKPNIIEPEILDEHGNPISTPEPTTRREKFHEKIHVYRQAGTWTGFVALMFSVLMMLMLAIVSVCFVIPLLLVGRIIGLSAQKLHH